MSGFGNWLGADFGGELRSSSVRNWSNEEWNALVGTDKPEHIGLNPDDIEFDPDVSNPSAPEDEHDDKFDLDAQRYKFGEIDGLLSDNTAYNAVRDALSGGEALNWEVYTFGQLRDEKNTLKTEQLQTLADAWTRNGESLKTESETFKKTVGDLITGKWSGESAAAAEAASQHVTKTSIYEFTPSSEEISDRLEVLKAAFENIKSRFPDGTGDVIDKFPDYNKSELDDKVEEFNSKYHFDDSGHLRASNGQYVDVATAIEEKNRIEQSIRDYQLAVQLFRDTYQPTVEAVTQNFPTLPAPPNMKFEMPTGPGPTGPGPTGPGPTGPGPGGPGPGISPPGIPPIDPADFKIPGNGKDPSIPDYLSGIGDPSLTDPNNPPITNPPFTPAQSLKPAIDAAGKGLNSGIDAATKAAQQAAQGAAAAGKKAIPSLREGALGLGDKPSASKGAGGGGGKGIGGGAGGGLGVSEPSARLSSQPTTSASGARAGVPAASSAGMGPMGAPMGGGGGAGGKGGDGKEHKANKALKRRKNGSDIVGDTDAVVPVLGDSPPPPEEKQPAPPPRRRIPQRGNNTWQPDSAPQSGAPSPQTQNAGSAGSD